MIFLFLLLSFNSCILLPMPERKLGEEQAQLKEILTLSDEKVYKEVIDKSRGFLELFPDSDYYDVVLLKLGEAYEGLLKTRYYKVVADGEP